MDYIRLGNSGLQITQVTYGTALTIGTERTDLPYAQSLVDAAWELGIRSFDVSNNYGNGQAEILLGQALSRYPREEYVLATKGSWPVGETPYHRGLSRKHILWAFDESMKRLNTDYVDIYYAHRYDPMTPMEEIVRTFNSLIESGRARYWGTSEWPVEALEECHQVCDRLRMEKPVVEQCIYSYAVRKTDTNGVRDFCRRNRVGMLGFSPLCQGLLTGKYRGGIPGGSRIEKGERLNYNKTSLFYEQNRDAIDRFLELCDKYHVKGAHAALLWCIQQEIYPVLGASRPQQLDDTLQAFDNPPPEDFWRELEGRPV